MMKFFINLIFVFLFSIASILVKADPSSLPPPICDCLPSEWVGDCSATLKIVGTWAEVSSGINQCARVDWFADNIQKTTIVNGGIEKENFSLHKPMKVEVQRCKICKDKRKKVSTRDDRFGVDESRFGVDESRYGVDESKYGVDESRFGVDESKYGVDESKYGVDESKYGVDESKYGVDSDRFFSPSTQPNRTKDRDSKRYAQEARNESDKNALEIESAEKRSLNQANEVESDSKTLKPPANEGKKNTNSTNRDHCSAWFKKLERKYLPPINQANAAIQSGADPHVEACKIAKLSESYNQEMIDYTASCQTSPNELADAKSNYSNAVQNRQGTCANLN